MKTIFKTVILVSLFSALFVNAKFLQKRLVENYDRAITKLGDYSVGQVTCLRY